MHLFQSEKYLPPSHPLFLDLVKSSLYSEILSPPPRNPFPEPWKSPGGGVGARASVQICWKHRGAIRSKAHLHKSAKAGSSPEGELKQWEEDQPTQQTDLNFSFPSEPNKNMIFFSLQVYVMGEDVERVEHVWWHCKIWYQKYPDFRSTQCMHH